jgi:uncharacterized protein
MKRAERFYRDYTETGRWKSFRVKVDTTDLFIRADVDVSGEAEAIVRRLRGQLWVQIDRQPEFLTALDPVARLAGCPEIAALMYDASERAGVGPMAAVAGAVAELAGRELAPRCGELIIENGGDIWMKLTEPASVTIFPGGHHFGTVALRIYPRQTPCGVCTSSARIGPSLSFGKADAATIIAPDAALADAIATDVCNRVKVEDDMEDAAGRGIERGATGVVIIFRDRLAARGEVELAE